MKNILIFLCTSFLFINIAKAQIKGEATHLIRYEANFAMDSTDRDERKTEIHSLYTSNEVSYYVSETYLKLDSLITEFQKNPQASMRRMEGNSRDIPRPEFLPKVYKNFKNSEALVSVRILRDNYIYKESEFPLNWEMEEESKKIGEYEAQKATTNFGGRKWTAWFTLQVPIQDGPYIFSGLPGLILELSDADDDYQFNVSSIKSLKEKFPIDSESKTDKKVDKAEFIKAYHNFRENPLGEFADRLRNMDIKFPDPTTGEMLSASEIIRKAKREAKKRNNYIERI